MKTLLRWLALTLVILALSNLMSSVTVNGFVAALTAALVLGLINTLLKPIITLIAFPINLLTFGLFTLVINAGLVLLAAAIVPGFIVAGFWSAVLFGFLLSIISPLISLVF
ncbi:phage holin family protein [Patescibacteria group bacterium]|nr:phage holin family protein [Patescibacteria group bacterium]